MTAAVSAVLLLLVTPSIGYGWGMRGTLLGRERGALLPGAILGFLWALFSGLPTVSANFWGVVAASALGCYFGGLQTYGETLGLSHSPGSQATYWKGILACFLKGGFWFAITAGIAGIAIRGSNIYKATDVIIIVAGIIVFRFLGERIFNHPHDPENGKLPKIYFSKTRREYWGGMLFISLFLLCFALYKGDGFTALMVLFGFLGGALGFSIGQMIQAALNLSQGSIAKTLHDRHILEGWKTMEITFGMIAGLVTTCGLIALNGMLAKDVAVVPLAEMGDTLSFVFVMAWIVLIAIYEIIRRYSRAELPEGQKPRGLRAFILKNDSCFMNALYLYPALFFVLLGNEAFTRTVAGPLLMWVVFNGTIDKYMKGHYLRPLVKIITILGTLALTVFDLLFKIQNMWILWAIYSPLYTGITFLMYFAPLSPKHKGTCTPFTFIHLGLYLVVMALVFVMMGFYLPEAAGAVLGLVGS